MLDPDGATTAKVIDEIEDASEEAVDEAASVTSQAEMNPKIIRLQRSKKDNFVNCLAPLVRSSEESFHTRCWWKKICYHHHGFLHQLP